MSDIIKEIRKIKEESQTCKIVIFTNHLKIVGTLREYQNEHFLTLVDVNVLDIGDLYPCERDGSCEEYAGQTFEWLHVSVEKILAFSFIK